MPRKRKTSGKTKFSVNQYLDPATLTKQDRETVQLLLKVPRYFKTELKHFVKAHYLSMTDCVQDAVWKLITGWNYIEAAQTALDKQIELETKEHYRALVSTINQFKEEIQRIGKPLARLATETDQIMQDTKKLAIEEIKKEWEIRVNLVKFKILQILHFEDLTTPQLVDRAAELSALPTFQIHEAIGDMVAEGLLVKSDSMLRIAHP